MNIQKSILKLLIVMFLMGFYQNQATGVSSGSELTIAKKMDDFTFYFSAVCLDTIKEIEKFKKITWQNYDQLDKIPMPLAINEVLTTFNVISRELEGYLSKDPRSVNFVLESGSTCKGGKAGFVRSNQPKVIYICKDRFNKDRGQEIQKHLMETIVHETTHSARDRFSRTKSTPVEEQIAFQMEIMFSVLRSQAPPHLGDAESYASGVDALRALVVALHKIIHPDDKDLIDFFKNGKHIRMTSTLMASNQSIHFSKDNAACDVSRQSDEEEGVLQENPSVFEVVSSKIFPSRRVWIGKFELISGNVRLGIWCIDYSGNPIGLIRFKELTKNQIQLISKDFK